MASGELEEIREALRYDTPYWASLCAKIIDKRRRLVPLEPYPWQIRLDRALEAQRAAGMPMRAIIVKARKLGFSTWVQAKMMQRVTQLPYQFALTIAQDNTTAGELFNMGLVMYQHLPSEEQLGLGFSVRPHLAGKHFSPSGKKYMRFGDPSRAQRLQGEGLESVIQIDTAKEKAAGRGFTPNLMHGSEVAHWEGTEKLLGVLNAVPDEPETLIVLESTANGLNHFHKRWVSAEEGAEDPDSGGLYVPIFAAWWEDPKNSRPFMDDEHRRRFISGIGTGPYGVAEPFLVDQLGLSPEQLYWRRTTIKDKTNDDPELFKQEYPATADEAFLGSGNPVFSSILVSKAIQGAATAGEPAQGWLKAEDYTTKDTRSGTVRVPTKVLWVPDGPREALHVWEHPRNRGTLPPERRSEPDGQYVLGVDCAQGLYDGDYSTIQVIDHRSREQVAEYRGHIDIDEFRNLVLLTAMYYNEALLAVEITGNIGLAVLMPLRRDYGYRRIYMREPHDTRQRRPSDRFGWDTNVQTKPLIEDNLREMLRDDTHGIKSRRLARELQTYVADEDKPHIHGAEEGEHDDLLMAYMIAQYVATLRRPKKTTSSLASFQPIDPLTGY